MLPVHLHTGLANHGHQVQLGVGLAKTVVGSGTEDKPVLGLLFGGTSNPAVRVERVGVGVSLLIVAGGPHRGDNHGALGHGDVLGNGEVLLDQVGNHDDGRAVAQSLLDDSTSVGQLVKQLHGQRGLDIAVANAQVLLADLVKNIGAVGHELEQPGRGSTSGILGGEQEGEDGLSDFVIGEVTQDLGGLVTGLDGNTLSDLLTVLGGILLSLDPRVHDTGDFSTRGHASLTLGSTVGELCQNHVGSLLAIPGLGVRQDKGEVNEFQGSSDHVVVIGDLLDSFFGDVVADESTAGHGAHELTEFGHPGSGLEVVLLRDAQETGVVLVVNLFHAREVEGKSLASEKTVETLAEFNVVFAVQEDPVVGTKKLVRNVHNTRLNVGGRVEDLARHVASGCDNNEPISR